jgi:hypothetical protein
MDVVGFFVKSKLCWSGPADLKMILAHSRYCRCADDRDRIYAFLGLAGQDYEIVPDYSEANSFTKVLVETARSIILSEDSLDILSHAVATRAHPTRKFPSWVPDWSCREFSDFRASQDDLASRINSRASRNTSANASFGDADNEADGLVLNVTGIYVDLSICEMIIDPSDNRSNGPYRGFQTLKGYIVTSTDLVEHRVELWILYGARNPFILRADGNLYHVISEAMVFSSKDEQAPNIIPRGNDGSSRRRKGSGEEDLHILIYDRIARHIRRLTVD